MNKKQIIYSALFLLITFYIFNNSLQNAAESSERSGIIVSVAQNILNFFKISVNPDFLTHIIRKIAHITEFAMQSFSAGGAILKSRKQMIIILAIGLITACIDESLQLTSPGRSGEFKDVVIDFSGTVIGILLYLKYKKINKIFS